MNKDMFYEQVKDLGIILTSDMKNQLEQFYDLLISWNQKMNLTRITDKEEVYLKHFYDSLTLAKICDLNQYETLCDIGSGAGFPGIVLKIVYPNLKITLIDSLQKRVNYLNSIIEKLSLTNIIAIHSRAEDYAKNHYEEYDIVTARAVANLNILLEIGSPLLKVNGHYLIMKGHCEEELKQVSNAFKQLNLTLNQHLEFLLPIENSNRTLLDIKKNGLTNRKYPRRTEQIIKKPLA